MSFRFSIITVCYNAEQTIEPTIQSVLSQTYPDIEYIIVDGASKDKTLDIVRKYGTKIAKVVSEKDKGIYDAMNKGVALASGDVIFFMNADDRFCDNAVLTDIANVFTQNPGRSLIYGDVRPEGAPPHIAPYLTKNFQFTSIKDFSHRTICHQAVFAKRSLFAVIGNFDLQYRYAADYDWLIRAYKYAPTGFLYVDRDIADFYYLGRSFQQNTFTQKENTKIRFKQLFGPQVIWEWFRYDVVRVLKKKALKEPL